MISTLIGTIVGAEKDRVVIQTAGGVGYGVAVGKLDGFLVGQEVTLFTYLKVSDQALDLYGFIGSEARDFFTLLLTVSGVGPKTAMNILSVGSIADIERAISRGDAAYLSAVQGIGKKTAERMVVELRSKIRNPIRQLADELRTPNSGTILSDVIDALVGMGYGKEDVIAVVRELEPDGKSTEALLREALQRIGR